MSFYSSDCVLPYIPDNLTIAQFMLDYRHPMRPINRHDIPCLIDDESGRNISFDELRESTSGLASALYSRYHVGDDDVVLIFGPNHVDYPIVIWATHRLGGVVSGANPNSTAEELIYQLTEVKASLIVAHPNSLDTALSAARTSNFPLDRIIVFDAVQSGNFPTIPELIAEGLTTRPTFIERTLEPGESKTKLALLALSSGTTGRPKAVAIPHGALIANIIQMASHNNEAMNIKSNLNRGYNPGGIAIGVLPFYHIAGLIINLHFVLFCAMTLVVIPKYNFLSMLNSVIRYRITHLVLVPPQAVALCKNPAVMDYDLSTVRHVLVGAAPMTKEINERLFEVFPTAQIGQCYGLTETCTTLTMIPLTQKRGTSGSAGRLIPGVIARVIKPDGTLARYGEPGELVVKTPSAALGYANCEFQTQETFVNGWVRTGDEVIINRDKEVFVLERLKEMIKVRGFQVAPAEIEGCLLSHPDVLDCCVVGLPDEYSGEIPLAYVVLNYNAAQKIANNPIAVKNIKATLIQHVAQFKISYKQLAGGVEIINTIPRNPSGKLLRRVLRDKAKTLSTAAKVKL